MVDNNYQEQKIKRKEENLEVKNEDDAQHKDINKNNNAEENDKEKENLNDLQEEPLTENINSEEKKVNNNNIDDLNTIKIRNEIVDIYIENLDNNKKPEEIKNSNPQQAEDEEEEEDEFAKAEASYKKSIANQIEKKESKLLHYNQLSSLKLITPKVQRVSSQPKAPGYLYQKENECRLKRQSCRRIRSKELRELELLNSKFIAHNNNNKQELNETIHEDKSNSNCNSKNLKTISKNIYRFHNSKNQSNRKSMDKDDRPQYYPEEIYSNRWTNNMLKLRYNSQLYIEKYINGVPQFLISKTKTKKKAQLPTV